MEAAHGPNWLPKALSLSLSLSPHFALSGYEERKKSDHHLDRQKTDLSKSMNRSKAPKRKAKQLTAIHPLSFSLTPVALLVPTKATIVTLQMAFSTAYRNTHAQPL